MNRNPLIIGVLMLVLLTALSANGQEDKSFKNPLEVKLKVNRQDYKRNSTGGEFAIADTKARHTSDR